MRCLIVVLLFAGVAWADVKTHIQYDGEISETRTIKGTIGGKSAKIIVVNGYLPKEVCETTELKIGLESRSFRFDNKVKYKNGMKVEYIKHEKLKTLGVKESYTNSDGTVTEGSNFINIPYSLKEH